MSELLPCPFCGGEAERLYGGEIRCKVAQMMTHNGTYPCPAHGSKVRFSWMWNRRVPQPLTPEQREALEEAADLCSGIFDYDAARYRATAITIRAMLEGKVGRG